MGTYYHGTTRTRKRKILSEGFILTAGIVNGRQLGEGVYFTPDPEEASYFGEVISVKLDEDRIHTFSSINDLNDFAFSALLQGKKIETLLRERGLIGYLVLGIDGSETVVVFNTTAIEILS